MTQNRSSWAWLPQRIFIDSTFTATSGRRSGIERVVHSLIFEIEKFVREYSGGNKELLEKVPQNSSYAANEPAKLETVIAVNGSFASLGEKPQRLLSGPAELRANVLACLPRVYDRASAALCRWTGSRLLKKWFRPEAGHLGIFKIPHQAYNVATRKWLLFRYGSAKPGAGDLLILPDAYWGRNTVWKAAAKARRRGAKIAVVIYDLIPLTHPEFVGQKRHNNFKAYLRNAINHADLLLTISNTVRDQLEEILPQYRTDPNHHVTTVSFPLGAEIRETTGVVRDPVKQVFGPNTASNPYLMVATFDPRKNHSYLLDAFDLLWDSGSTEKLCFVGRVGSLCEPLMRRIEQHRHLNKNLFLFHDVTDAELQYCYSQSKGVLFPSIVEGFGLPIIEALWHRKRTLVSDTPIHREVGGERCEYFQLGNPSSLVELLEYPEDRIPKITASPLCLPTWEDCGRSLLKSCVNLFELPPNQQATRRAA